MKIPPPPGTPTCPVCGEAVAPPTAAVCRGCQTTHHLECWRYSKGCSVFGCGQRIFVRAVAPPRRESQQSSEDFAEFLSEPALVGPKARLTFELVLFLAYVILAPLLGPDGSQFFAAATGGFLLMLAGFEILAQVRRRTEIDSEGLRSQFEVWGVRLGIGDKRLRPGELRYLRLTPGVVQAQIPEFEVRTMSGETLVLESGTEESVADMLLRVNRTATILDKIVEWVGDPEDAFKQLPAPASEEDSPDDDE